MLDKNVTVGIILIFPKLNVTPLESYQLPLAQAGPEGSEEERVVLWALLPCGPEKPIPLRSSQGRCLALWSPALGELP